MKIGRKDLKNPDCERIWLFEKEVCVRNVPPKHWAKVWYTQIMRNEAYRYLHFGWSFDRLFSTLIVEKMVMVGTICDFDKNEVVEVTPDNIEDMRKKYPDAFFDICVGGEKKGDPCSGEPINQIKNKYKDFTLFVKADWDEPFDMKIYIEGLKYIL